MNFFCDMSTLLAQTNSACCIEDYGNTQSSFDTGSGAICLVNEGGAGSTYETYRYDKEQFEVQKNKVPPLDAS